MMANSILQKAALAILLVMTFVLHFETVNGHGRLIEPPNRSSMWRLPEFEGMDLPVNYDDDQLYCGAIGKMINNGGKCGVCGDDWESPSPRDNENSGKYGLGIVVRNYEVGQTIDIAVDITTSHWGYFEFRICPLIGEFAQTGPEDYNCFDDYILELGDGSGTRYNLTSDQPGWFNTTVKLPPTLTCDRCVLQWHYRAGNTWNFCGDSGEDESLGNVYCGYQETFRGCADISIGAGQVGKPNPPKIQHRPPLVTNEIESSPSPIIPEDYVTPSTGNYLSSSSTSTSGINHGNNNRRFPTMRPPRRYARVNLLKIVPK